MFGLGKVISESVSHIPLSQRKDDRGRAWIAMYRCDGMRWGFVDVGMGEDNIEHQGCIKLRNLIDYWLFGGDQFKNEPNEPSFDKTGLCTKI